jgi:3-phenylpropionate/cinnamic acid dioxygenase small subunit
VSTRSDRDELVELLARYASIPDAQDWDELPASVFADQVIVDYESLGMGPAREVARDDLISQLRTSMAQWEATHHAITNHQVTIDGDVAAIRAHVFAQHWLPADAAAPGRNR